MGSVVSPVAFSPAFSPDLSASAFDPGGGAPAGNSLPAFQVGDVNYVHQTGSAGTNYDGAIPSPAAAAATLQTVNISATSLDGLLTGTLPIAGLASLTSWRSSGNSGLVGTFDISGCAALTDLRILFCGHSGSFSALPANLVFLNAGFNNFSGIIPSFDGCASLEQFIAQNNGFSSWAGTLIPAGAYNINFSGNALDLTTVDALIDAAETAGWGAGGQAMNLTGGTNAAPSAPQAAKVIAMNLAGANITTN